MITLRTLGALDLVGPDAAQAQALLRGPKRVALLVYLCLARPGGHVRRDTLLALLWPELDEERARSALRTMLRLLRQQLGEGALLRRGDDEVGVDAAVLICDAAEFVRALETDDLERAMALYRGDLLPGFHLADGPEFVAWLDTERTRLQRGAQAAARRLAARAAEAGAPETAAAWLHRAWRIDPADEVVLRELVECLDRCGDRGSALAAYDAFARWLAHEYDAEPAPETRRLVERVRSRIDVTAPAQPDTAPPVPDESAPISTRGRPPTQSVRGSGAAYPPRVRRRRLGAFLSLAAVMLITALAATHRPAAPEAVPPFVGERVFVAGFDNGTGDASFDDVAAMAGAWVADEIARTGLVNVVPRDASAPTSRRGPLGAAADVGARLLVAGRVEAGGDSLRFILRVIDVGAGVVLATPAPVPAPRRDFEAALVRVADGALAALGPLVDPRLAVSARLQSSPPSYAAYRAFAQGLEHYYARRGGEAVPHFRAAYGLDTAFTLPLLYLGMTQMATGEWAAADSITARVLLPRRASLAPYDRLLLDRNVAHLRGDRRGWYEAARAAAEVAPGSLMSYEHARAALALNRPHEAVRLLRALDPDRAQLQGFSAYWNALARALHLIGEHEQELAVAGEVARRYHSRDERWLVYALCANAALGRLDAMEPLVEQALQLPTAERGAAGFGILIEAADELRAHGHPDAARALLERAVAHFEGAPPAVRENQRQRMRMGRAQYRLGRYAEARRIFERLAAEPIADREFEIDIRAHVGLAAARMGDREAARTADAWLAALTDPYLHGQNSEYRAQIAAVLGERDRAVSLLRQAVAEGRAYDSGKHHNPDYAGLRGYAPFEEWLRPKG